MASTSLLVHAVIEAQPPLLSLPMALAPQVLKTLFGGCLLEYLVQ
jgi:hypothetical protein